jgi:NitT/TauT family transport system substrate-binding protein
MRNIGRLLLSSGIALAAMATAPRAEVKEVILGQQFGAVYLPAMVMESLKLVEKHLAADGMGDVKVSWAKLGGPAAINDAMLSGNLHFACQGIPSLAVIWDRTRGGIGVKALGALASNNVWLNTRNPNIQSLKDFTEKDRIAVPSLKVSTQAIMMHIAAEQLWGKGNHTKLDHIIVALPHPEALAAVLSQVHEVNAHFATSPFHEAEMAAGLKTVTTGFDIMGGPTTGVTFTSNEKFRSENPRVFAAVNKAFDESFDWINSDKRRAAKLYIEMTKEKKLTEDDLTASFSGQDMIYTKVPSKVGKLLDFLHSTAFVKNKPASWKDLFFQEAHGLPGS